MRNFFTCLAQQNRKAVHDKSEKWSFDFEGGKEIFESRISVENNSASSENNNKALTLSNEEVILL